MEEVLQYVKVNLTYASAFVSFCKVVPALHLCMGMKPCTATQHQAIVVSRQATCEQCVSAAALLRLLLRLHTLLCTAALAFAGGEVDVRGCYTAMATAHMLKLDKQALAQKAGMVQYVKRCQVSIVPR